MNLKDIGKKLYKYRTENNISPDEIARILSVSRAAVYRIESGEIVKLDTLEKLARLLNSSVPAVLGIGAEYYSDAVSYFNAMKVAEEHADQVLAYFPPFSYLLTSEHYETYLRQMLTEGLHGLTEIEIEAEKEKINSIIDILNKRKKNQKKRCFSVVNFVNAIEIEKWLKIGMIGCFGLSENVEKDRRIAARLEVEHLINIIKSQPIGVQIAVTTQTIPNTAFQLFKTSKTKLLGISPYKLGGDMPNITTGVAYITSEALPIKFYESMCESLWEKSLKGAEAVELLERILKRSALY